jgi:nucleotide-binding universal stress UspA family protein
MTATVPDRPKVLVPLAVLDGESLAPALVEALSTVPVELVGYHAVPEQTPPGQARMQFEERMETELADLVETFEAAGGTVETRLVFTHEPEQTFERVAVEKGCDAVLLNNPATKVEEILVPLRSEINVERIVALVASVLDATDATATLYHVAAPDDEADRETGQRLVDAATESLAEAGVAPERVDREIAVSETPIKTLAAAAAEYDLVVMGESKPSVRELFFGEVSEQVASQSVTPALVVRRLPALKGEGESKKSGEAKKSGESKESGETRKPGESPGEETE